MAEKKIKIVLDADVIIHFVKGGLLNLLPKIFPEYQYIILDIVKKELPDFILSVVLTLMKMEGTIKEEIFGKTNTEKKEYLRLIAIKGPHLGRGESACMVYCRYNHDVVGSSNTKDITEYCNEHRITYLTTNDFLYYAIRRGLITKEEADNFISKVRAFGSFPPVVDFQTYICTKL